MRKWIWPALLLAGVGLLHHVQFMTPTLWEADGYYHIRMADEFRQRGVIRQFPWAQYSFFATHFADKDLLYHLFLIPFAGMQDLFHGAKVAAFLGGAFLFLSFAWILRRIAAPRWSPVFLVLFFLSDHFLSALARPRPMVLAIALMLWGIHFILKRRSWALFLTTLLYGYLHISALILVGMAAIVEGLRWTEEKRGSLLPVFAAAAGLAVSLLFHPHFPNNLRFLWLNLFLVPYYAAKSGVLELGGEFFPIDTHEFLLGYPAVGAFLLGLPALAMFRSRPVRFETQAYFFCMLPLLAMSFLSQRYLIHCYPVFLLWAAALLSDLLPGPDPQSAPDQTAAGSKIGKAIWGAALVLILASGARCWKWMQLRALSEQTVNSHYERFGRWMYQNLPPGETIFHANWSDSQYFIGIDPKARYFVTLDPIYLYAWNPDFYRLYRDVAHGRLADPYAVMKDAFHVRFGYAGKRYFGALVQQVQSDPRFQILLDDPLGTLFMLKDSVAVTGDR